MPEPEGRRDPCWVGRARELGALDDALARAREGHPSVTVITGPRGSGRSALVRRFVRATHDAGTGVALYGEAQAGVHVPFRGAEGVMTALAGAIQSMSHFERSRLLSDDLAVAARMLPGLRRIRDVAEMYRDAPHLAESAELRDLGFSALAELLRKLAARRPVAVVIDDVDRRDEDVDLLLAHVFWPERSPPPVAFVATAPTLGDARLPVLADALEPRHFELGALAPEEAVDLARRQLSALGGDARDAGELATRAGGLPGEIEALARGMVEGLATSGEGGALELSRARIASLSPRARQALEVLAACDFPLPRPAVARAAALGEHANAALGELVRAGFVEASDVRDREALRVADRDAREGALAGLSEAERAERHLHAAEQLDLYGEAEAAAVASGLARAGHHGAAARRALTAAHQAREQLAFARAAELFESALELGAGDLDARRPIHVELGEILAHLGRRVQSAAHFAFAADAASAPEERARYRGRAAEQFAVAGYTADALELAELALGVEVSGRGWRRAPGRRARRAATRARHRRPPLRESPDALSLERIDLCWGLGLSFATSDPARAAAFHGEQLSRALRAGDSQRIALGFASAAAGEAGRGEAGRHRAAELTAQATELARQARASDALAFVEHAAGVRALELGAWTQALEHALRARSLLAGGGHLRSFEALAIAIWEPVALYYLGSWGELALRRQELVRTARERGDGFAEHWLGTGHAAIPELARGDVRGARESVARAAEAWHGPPAPIHHADAFATAHIDLSDVHAEGALDRLSARWNALVDSSLYRQRRARIDLLTIRALCELAVASERKDEGARAAAVRTARQLARQRTPASSALSQLVRAGAFAACGDLSRAVSWLRAAESSLDRAGMAVHAAAARRRRGELVGGSAGDQLIASADRALFAEQIAEPARICAMLVAGQTSASTPDRELSSEDLSA